MIIRRYLLAGLITLPGYLQAMECDFLRSYFGAEMITGNKSDSVWQAEQPAFKSKAGINHYLLSAGRCDLSDSLKVRGELNASYLVLSKDPGDFEGRQHQGRLTFSHLYATQRWRNQTELNIGKKRYASGYLFMSSPLDLLRNTSGRPQGVPASTMINSPDEGAWGAGGTLFNDSGSFTLAILPALPSHHRSDSAANWPEGHRTNQNERYYISYNFDHWPGVNHTWSALLGQQKTVAMGLNTQLSPTLILSLESAVSYGQTWAHFGAQAAHDTLTYQQVTAPFTHRQQGVNSAAGVGLRYSPTAQYEYGIEYFGQSEGYSRKAWQQYTQSIAFVTGDYRKPFPDGTLPESVRKSYQQYARVIAAQADNQHRRGKLAGKHYLTLYSRSNQNSLYQADWLVSGVINLMDRSYVLNLGLSLPVSSAVDLYSGAAIYQGSKASEFGLFGHKGEGYVGMRIFW